MQATRGGDRRRPASDRARARPRPAGARARRRARRRSRHAASARLPSSTGPSTVTPYRPAQRVARGADRDRVAPLSSATPTERRASPAPGDGRVRRRPRRAAHAAHGDAPPRGRAAGSGAAARPPPARGPSRRAARTSSHSACSAARCTGASSSWSNSRNATEPHGTAGRQSVEHGFGADQHVGVGHRAPSSRRPRRPSHVGAARRGRRARGHTRAARRGTGCRGSAGRSAAAPCRSASTLSAVVVLPHRRAAPLAAGQLAARPAREQPGPTLAVQHAHRSPAASRTPAQLVGEHAREQRRARAARRGVSTTVTTRPPARASSGRRGCVVERDERVDRRRRQYVDADRRARRARARSTATSRAFHVGARSSSSASSASSTTTMRARSGTGAHTAVRPPTTTHAPARARSHAAVSSAALRSRAQARPLRARRSRACVTSARGRSASGSITMLDPSGASQPRRRAPRGRRSGATRSAAAPPCASSDGGYTAVSSSGSMPAATTFGGDAARSNVASGSGPSPRRPLAQVDDVGRRAGRHDRVHVAAARARRPRARTSASSTQPRTRRPCSGTRTIVPTRTSAAGASGAVVERAVGSRARRAATRQTRVSLTRDAYASAFGGPARSSSAASVRSQVKSRSDRPKCPYAAVLRKIGRRRSSRSMIAAGRRSKCSRRRSGQLLRVDLGGPERLDHHRHGVRDADRVRDLHLAARARCRRPRRSSRRGAPRTRPSGRPSWGPCR